MTYALIFNSEAEQEFREAYEWYEQQSKGLGGRFERAVEVELMQILSNPRTFHYSKGKYREALVLNFPFTIVYSENTKKRIIYISAIFHTSRNPKLKYRKAR